MSCDWMQHTKSVLDKLIRPYINYFRPKFLTQHNTDQLSPFEVRVGNSMPATNINNTNALCNSYVLDGVDTTGAPPNITCRPGVLRGRYVSIQRVGYKGYMSLCDVKVRCAVLCRAVLRDCVFLLCAN